MRPKKKKTIHASCTDWDQQTKEEWDTGESNQDNQEALSVKSLLKSALLNEHVYGHYLLVASTRIFTVVTTASDSFINCLI